MAGVAASSERAMWWEHEPIGLSSHLPQETTCCYCCWCLQLADWRLIICPEVSLTRCWQCLECTPFCNDSFFFSITVTTYLSFALLAKTHFDLLSGPIINNLITNNWSDQRIKDSFQCRKANVPITFTLYIKLDGPCSGIDSVRPPWFGISTSSRLYLYTCAFEILSVPDKY